MVRRQFERGQRPSATPHEGSGLNSKYATMVGQTVVEKIAQAHRSGGAGDRPLRTGDFLAIRVAGA